MKRTHILSCGLLVAAIVMVGLASIGSNVPSYFDIVNAGSVELLLDGSSFSSENVAIIETGKHNYIEIHSTGNGLSLASGQSISNHSMIQGLTQLNVVLSSGSAVVYGDYVGGMPRNRVMEKVTTSNSSVTMAEGMRYFEIVASEDTVIAKVSITYNCPLDMPHSHENGNLILDGIADDPVWTDAVKTNYYRLQKDSNNYVTIYGTKRSDGLCLFMDYTVSELATCTAGEWWTWENVEFRLANNDKAWSAQYWLSSMNGGSFVSDGSGEGYKAEDIFYKSLVQRDDNNYHGAFELFVPYGDDKLVVNEMTYAKFGWAPKAGWYAGYNWDKPNADDTLNITEDGFAHGDGTYCPHHFDAEWVIDTVPDCMNGGSASWKCDCGHEIIQRDLAKDYSNHTDADYPSTHNHCHDCGIGSYLNNAGGDVFDRSNAGGPWDKNNWHDFGLFEGDFKFAIDFHMEGCKGAGNTNDDACWRTVLPFVYKEGYSNAPDGHFFRMDWCGYGGENFVKDINNGATPEGFDWGICREAYSNMDVKLVYTKVGANIKLDWVWECKTDGGYFKDKTYEYHQSCNLIDPSAKVGIALASEFAYCLITKAELSR